MSPGELRALLVELVVTRGAFATWGPVAYGRSLTQACKLYRVDLSKLRASVKAEIAVKVKAKKR